MKSILMLVLTLLCASLSAKVRILTFHYNEPEFLEVQYASLQKFMQNDFELIVFNDGNTPERESAIREMCDKLGIQCVRFEQQWHLENPYNENLKRWVATRRSWLAFRSYPLTDEIIAQQPSVRHSHVIEYALHHFGYDHDDIVVILDGDAFAISPIDLKKEMKDRDIIGAYRVADNWIYKVGEKNTEYLWVTFIAFDPRKLPNKQDFHFFPDLIDNSLQDTGSHIYNYLKANPEVKVQQYPVYWCYGNQDLPLDDLKKREERDLIMRLIRLVRRIDPQTEFQLQFECRLMHYGYSSYAIDGRDRKKERILEFMRGLL
jgi:glycosyltransferase involved in cell wall biosynthesis